MSKRMLLSLVISSAALAVSAAPRDVQIVSIDLEAQVLELHNFGASAEALDGWRFCSHDESVIRRYSSSGGLNGVSLAGGESLFVHFLNDCGGGSDCIDLPAGSFALPLDTLPEAGGAYAIGLYFAPVSFGNGNTIADHIQFSIDGVDNLSADERSDEAESGGVWTDQTAWIPTQTDSTAIELLPASEGLVLHGPADYEVLPEPGAPLGLACGGALLALLTRARRCRAAGAAGRAPRGWARPAAGSAPS